MFRSFTGCSPSSMSVSVCLYSSNIKTPVEDSTERKSTPTATELKFTREQKRKTLKARLFRRSARDGQTSFKKASLHNFARALLCRRDDGDGVCVCGHGCTTLFKEKKKVFIRNQYVVSKRQSVCVLYKWYICVFFICASLRNCDLLYCMQCVSPPRIRLSAVTRIDF